jgi:hypothetical protein
MFPGVQRFWWIEAFEKGVERVYFELTEKLQEKEIYCVKMSFIMSTAFRHLSLGILIEGLTLVSCMTYNLILQVKTKYVSETSLDFQHITVVLYLK